MSHYQSFDPNTEIIGLSVQGLIKSILHHDIAAILKKRGLDHIDARAWYPLQDVLDVLNDIDDGGVNVSSSFVSIGMAAAESSIADMSDQLRNLSVHTFLDRYWDHFQQRHRGGDIGFVEYHPASDNHIVMALRTPYPDDVMYGVFYSYVRFLTPANRTFSIYYDQDYPTYEQGGDETIIHIVFSG